MKGMSLPLEQIRSHLPLHTHTHTHVKEEQNTHRINLIKQIYYFSIV